MIAGLLAGGLAANAVLRQPARYFSRAVLQIDQLKTVVESGGVGPVEKLSQLRGTYALLAKTRRVTAPVAQKTGLPEGLVASAISVILPGETMIVIVDARTGDPARARTIADATAQELVTLIAAQMDAAKIPAEQRITMAVVAPAQPGVKFEPTRSRALTSGSLAGILAFVGIIAIVESLRAFRRLR